MLKQLHVVGFKSLRDVTLDLPKLTVLFGPNAVGKSNILDAIATLSRIAGSRTLKDVFADPIRGNAIEAFSFPAGGLKELVSMGRGSFRLDAQIMAGDAQSEPYRYFIEIEIDTRSGSLVTADEYLAPLTKYSGEARGKPRLEREGDRLLIRRKGEAGTRREEKLPLHYAVLSDQKLSGDRYPDFDAVRQELFGWRSYYLDPRVAMRQAQSPAAVDDIGLLGQHIGPFLYRLRADDHKRFLAVKRMLRSLIPSVDDIEVDLNEKTATLELSIRQDGTPFSSRVVSEGTLRVLALCAIALNPWNQSLLAFEEPENGVHPRRLELIADLLTHLAIAEGRQLVVATHSPLFCDAVLKRAQKAPADIGLLNVRQQLGQTVVMPLDVVGPLFTDQEIRKALSSDSEDGLFESLMLRGLIDAG